ncbi:MAG TPA: aminotransferase class V-fold PLP-dependent enzyme [Bacteroidales bacterium]|nr:aminotransferase class V-fold PLP-dependent enzyme [Bacteroidales bacterium]
MTAHGTSDPFGLLEQGVLEALKTYSNVHRGSGHFSMVTTHLYERAREIVLDYLKLDHRKYTVVFCTPERASALISKLEPDSFECISSMDINLPLGVRALAVKRNALPKGAPLHSGGGTARLVSKDWVLWSDAPSRFEAGTPAIINIIAFARALLLINGSHSCRLFDNKEERLQADDILFHDQLEKYSGTELLENLRGTFPGIGVSVPTCEGLKPYINLDNAASTPAPLPVWKAVCQTWRQPEDTHIEIIDKVKRVCAEMVGAVGRKFEILFTSNTTESINLAAENLQLDTEKDIEPVIINTIIEHNSNDLPWRSLPGYSMIKVSADANGFVDIIELEKLLSEYNLQNLHGRKRIRLMAVCGGSNVLGVFNNIDDISRIVHHYGALLFVDAAQVIAHRSIDMEKSGIDFLAFSAHKAYAPFGTGVLAARKELIRFDNNRLAEIISSGEENVVGIAALGKALVLLQRIEMNNLVSEEQRLTTIALNGLSEIDGMTIYGIKDPESPSFIHKGGVILVNMRGIMASGMAKRLAFQGGIGTRSGCHCAHILIKKLANVGPSLEKFQKIMVTLLPGMKLPGLLRISLGIENSEEDIKELLLTLNKISQKEQSSEHKHIKKEINDFISAAEQKVFKLTE